MAIYIQAIIYSLLCYLHDCALKSCVRCYFRKILVSVQKRLYLNKKNCITNKKEKEKEKKIEEEPLLTLPENEWYVIF